MNQDIDSAAFGHRPKVCELACEVLVPGVFRDLRVMHPEQFEREQRDIENLFFALVEPGPGGCWHWKGNMHRDDAKSALLPVFRPFGSLTQVSARRYCFEHFYGKVMGLVKAKCKNEFCVNPSHVVVTVLKPQVEKPVKASMRDRVEALLAGGYSKTMTTLAKELGCPKSTLYSVLRRLRAGRKQTRPIAASPEQLRELCSGNKTPLQIARECNISRAYVYHLRLSPTERSLCNLFD